MKPTQDRRIRRTRAQLRIALEQLLQTKPIGDITVTELCQACDINRSTFYLHYTDAAHLLHSIESEILSEFEQILNQLQDFEADPNCLPSKAMCDMFDFLAKNAGMARALLCYNADNTTMEHVKDIVRRRLVPHKTMYFSTDPKNVGAYAFAFIVSGGIGLLQEWLANDMPIAPHDMATIMETILAKGIDALQR